MTDDQSRPRTADIASAVGDALTELGLDPLESLEQGLHVAGHFFDADQAEADTTEAWMRRKFGSTPADVQRGDPLDVADDEIDDPPPHSDINQWMRDAPSR